MAQAEDDLPPLGMMDILPVVGMLLGILVAILYACGCLGGSSTSSYTRLSPGSGSKGFIKNPEGFDDEEDDDEDDKDK